MLWVVVCLVFGNHLSVLYRSVGGAKKVTWNCNYDLAFARDLYPNRKSVLTFFNFPCQECKPIDYQSNFVFA